jgi:hypothetical protein
VMNEVLSALALIWQFLDDHDGAVTAVATAVIAAYTVVLSVSTKRLWRQAKTASEIAKAAADQAKRSVDLAEASLVAGERAFIFAVGIAPLWEKSPDGKVYCWRFRPSWNNSGDTPTRELSFNTECVLLDKTDLPKDFNFDQDTQPPGKGLIPPKSTLSGSQAPKVPLSAITPQDLADMQGGRKHLFFWGWARYRDIFPNTPQHITRFCWMITVVGDPFNYDPNSDKPEHRLVFSYVLYSLGNCADEECT